MSFTGDPISFGDCTDCTPCGCVEIPSFKVYQVSGNSDGSSSGECTNTGGILSACEAAFATDPDWSLIGPDHAGTIAIYCDESCLCGDGTPSSSSSLTVGAALYAISSLYSPINTATNQFKWNKIRMRVFGPCSGFCVHYLEGGSITIESGAYIQTGGTPATEYHGPIADGGYIDIYPPTDLCSLDQSLPSTYPITCGSCPGDTTTNDGDP
jgi:hypothetical protein